MATPDVIVVGAGISGLAFAFKAAQAGKTVLVLEQEQRIGGCLHSERRPDGFWFEMGAHTTYNSYGSFLDIAVGTSAAQRLVPRGPARARFGLLRDGRFRWLSPPKVLLLLNWLEAAIHFPFGVFHKKQGQTIRSHYSRLIGPRNFDRVFSPFFAAVPSQSADNFPVEGDGSLFKKRPRREEFPRSFGFEGGLQEVCDGVARAPRVTIETGVTVRRVRKNGSGFSVETEKGRVLGAPLVAVAVPAHAAASMLRDDFSELSSVLAKVKMVTVESVGVVLPREKAWMPECAFVVPVNDTFYSMVTRDPFADARFRAFAFHFKAGLSREEKLKRMGEVLGVPVGQLGDVVEKRVMLPSPEAGHAAIVAEIVARLSGSKLALAGNYFAGLAIEDCVLRSNAEWARISAT